MIKVICEGGAGRLTRIVDSETGEDLGKRVPISYGAKITIGQMVTMEAEIPIDEAEIEIGRMKWLITNPVTRQLEEPARIVFADGTSVVFRSDGVPELVAGKRKFAWMTLPDELLETLVLPKGFAEIRRVKADDQSHKVLVEGPFPEEIRHGSDVSATVHSIEGRVVEWQWGPRGGDVVGPRFPVPAQ